MISKSDSVKEPELIMNEPQKEPILSSMSYIRFKKEFPLCCDELEPDSKLLLVLEGVTAQFVTKEKYQQLLFILGQKNFSSVGDEQNFPDILQLFNTFSTKTKENFKDMLNAFQFPFVYNDNLSISVNWQDFKVFFLV